MSEAQGAHEARGHWAGRPPGKAPRIDPGSQETCLRPPGRSALVERGGSHMKHRISGLAAVTLASALLAPAAGAAPVSVQLRIEGPTRTLFEGPVATDVRTFH